MTSFTRTMRNAISFWTIFSSKSELRWESDIRIRIAFAECAVCANIFFHLTLIDEIRRCVIRAVNCSIKSPSISISLHSWLWVCLSVGLRIKIIVQEKGKPKRIPRIGISIRSWMKIEF
jgi:hypothetical protein